MSKPIYQKAIIHLSILGVAISILVGFYDVIFHSLLDFIHTFLEVIEIGLDNLMEHALETDLRETQIIVFYIMLFIGGGLIYFVWKVSVKVVLDGCRYLGNEWVELKTAVIEDWQGMTMTNRIILISAFLLINYLASFLLF